MSTGLILSFIHSNTWTWGNPRFCHSTTVPMYRCISRQHLDESLLLLIEHPGNDVVPVRGALTGQEQ
eukprot:409348-Hanusia_phi.AAC.1